MLRYICTDRCWYRLPLLLVTAWCTPTCTCLACNATHVASTKSQTPTSPCPAAAAYLEVCGEAQGAEHEGGVVPGRVGDSCRGQAVGITPGKKLPQPRHGLQPAACRQQKKPKKGRG